MTRKLLLVLPLMLFSILGFAQPTSNFCATETTHFAGDAGSEILLTIENVDANTMVVEIESADADMVDLLIIVNGSGALISPEDFSTPGKIRRTLMWGAPPTNVNLNVLWSKASFPGNWQLSTNDISVPFAAVCSDPPPPSDYCAEEVTHFAGDAGSEILLTIANVDATTMVVEIESADADPVDFLLVLNGSGAVISGEDFSTPGKIRRTLTWGAPPTDVALNLLWSKASFGGNWQLSTTDITVPFAATCPMEPDPGVSDYCEEEVTHFGGDAGSEVFLTITNVDATTMIVEIESADADPVDLLIVVNGSGAAISAEDFSTPGKISRTLTWAAPPTDVALNVLWSKASFGGNWQLSTADITVPFVAACPVDPPNPVFCEEEVTHFAGDAGSEIFLTIANLSSNSMIVEIQSANADPVDFLLVVGGSGAVVSDQQARPGFLRRVLTWTNPPEDVLLNVLWSKESFPGNWQLSTSDVTVSFDAECEIENIPTMGQWGLLYLALIILILGLVYLPQAQTRMELATAGANQNTSSFSFSQFPFEKADFMAALKTTLYIVPIGFVVIFAVWNEIIFDDIIGMALAIPLVAYLIYLIKR